ncbi:bifunctional ADP-dependent NAD(P)H-hydrate dehydratase/NAD(P)H-hydrate epimerase [Desulfovibrio litoralis]|uniref:Bifunctional NAD(P)H-hydrate repair enzyme n=1 Tax=Desulfovibrio litoralis DSM 11393 TaxID=1121455 RepID=A0A1M7SRW7_9BACT|nr:bifunctional ADP-dependent NAD(P)H-hydrate dehydratase/NAD(P)H-hydrate epimerase [Desulfovibrio litoralis]SHN61219.1 NAD(P)H-hydrate epimerase [Desulfovibrio litoralis DSM 11393]
MSQTILNFKDITKPVTSVEEMSLWDNKASEEYGLHTNILMENAGRAAFYSLKSHINLDDNGSVLVICGSGNNGGDGAVLSRCLHDFGCNVTLAHLKPLSRYTGAAKLHIDLAKKCGVNFLYLRRGLHSIPNNLQTPDIIVDAILGTGVKGQLNTDFLDLINWINSKRKHSYIFSIDIPSGLNAMTAEPLPVAIEAHLTVSFEAAKPALLLPQAKTYVGCLDIQQIGIPSKLKDTYPASYACFNISSKLKEILRPNENLHKGSAGSVIVVGGSKGLTGAPFLSALAAIRTGSGLVSIAAPSELCPQIKSGNANIMTIPLYKQNINSETIQENLNEDWHPTLIKDLWLRLKTKKYNNLSLVLGPGMGRSPEAAQFLSLFFKLPISIEERMPLIVDADALFHLANGVFEWTQLSEKDILTPHPGEAARLLKCQIEDIENNRFEAIKELSKKTLATVILKGAGTLISKQNNNKYPIIISHFAEPNLSVGGSGDVLSGICGSLAAKGFGSFESTALGVYIHGLCGEYLKQKFPLRGNLASEIAESIPFVLANLEKNIV